MTVVRSGCDFMCACWDENEELKYGVQWRSRSVPPASRWRRVAVLPLELLAHSRILGGEDSNACEHITQRTGVDLRLHPSRGDRRARGRTDQRPPAIHHRAILQLHRGM